MAEIIVSDIYGSTWACTALLPSRLDRGAADEGIRIQIGPDTIHTIPADLVHSIRWSSGLLMLASADPAETNIRTSFPIQWKNDAALKWFGPKASGASDSNNNLDHSEQQDLILHGGSSVQYRVDDGYRMFSGVVQRGEQIKKASSVMVRIKLDDRIVWENASSDSNPQGFELELDEARRITLEVDSGLDGDLGTIVRMVRPRLVK